jgi:hypothetical protein
VPALKKENPMKRAWKVSDVYKRGLRTYREDAEGGF